mmetsp:Transcript_15322/g.33324  ORF Transcript_15322/g.33324 Transcript_15322/m.33324 type:complete len:90 (-) Transcript_15322:206-475(-)
MGSCQSLLRRNDIPKDSIHVMLNVSSDRELKKLCKDTYRHPTRDLDQFLLFQQIDDGKHSPSKSKRAFNESQVRRRSSLTFVSEDTNAE